MESSHEPSFLPHYQNLLFDEQNGDSYHSASIRRKCLAQMFKASITLSNNITTCSLYEKNIKSYAEIVDDQNSVNNYAESVQTLLSCSQVECQNWKSSLDNECSEKIPSCSSHVVSAEDIEFLVNACRSESDTGKTFPKTSDILNQNKWFLPRKCEDIDDMEEKDRTSSTKFSMKNVETSGRGVFPVGKGNDASVNANIRTRKNILDNGKSPVCEFKTNCSDSLKPMNVVSYNTLRHNPYQPLLQQNATNSSYSHPSNEPKTQNFESKNQNSESKKSNSGFISARDELVIQNQKKWGSRNTNNGFDYGAQKKSLGSTRRSVMNKFIPPIKSSDEECNGMVSHHETPRGSEEVVDERLKNIDPKMIELIQNEIMDNGCPVHWDDIAGLQFAKTTIQEIVVWPMLRPEIFTGLRRPPKGILLFGPPGTGKTLIGKCIASQSLSTFFSISASSLTSKWIGDGEKMVRALFAVARCHQPAVIFIDEIDSLLTQRSDTEHESSRRIKTEFLVQLDGATTGEEDRILVVGATNRPQELDEAARRRLVKRLYIPLPDHEARFQIIQRLMSKENNNLTEDQINELGTLTEGYSGADVKNLCQEASLGPIRSISFMDIQRISPDQVRPIAFEDFQSALKRVRASVSSCDLDVYLKWDKTYGSG